MSQQKPKKQIRNIFLFLIRKYQMYFSPDHSPRKALYPNGYCPYYPSCSEYGYQAIEKYGIFKGGLKALLRVVRCNPWTKGGSDPLT